LPRSPANPSAGLPGAAASYTIDLLEPRKQGGRGRGHAQVREKKCGGGDHSGAAPEDSHERSTLAES